MSRVTNRTHLPSSELNRFLPLLCRIQRRDSSIQTKASIRIQPETPVLLWAALARRRGGALASAIPTQRMRNCDGRRLMVQRKLRGLVMRRITASPATAPRGFRGVQRAARLCQRRTETQTPGGLWGHQPPCKRGSCFAHGSTRPLAQQHGALMGLQSRVQYRPA